MKNTLLKSHSSRHRDFDSKWYKYWANALKQDSKHLGNFDLYANKFWQNAIMAQLLNNRNMLVPGNSAIGFGVGKERLLALFAQLGVIVEATDQDFTKENAKLWDNDQLAEGLFSLNNDGICDEAIFNQNVNFSPVNMERIPKRYYSNYNFLWSNCALGHLGSIDKGLNFITNSLEVWQFIQPSSMYCLMMKPLHQVIQ